MAGRIERDGPGPEAGVPAVGACEGMCLCVCMCVLSVCMFDCPRARAMYPHSFTPHHTYTNPHLLPYSTLHPHTDTDTNKHNNNPDRSRSGILNDHPEKKEILQELGAFSICCVLCCLS